MGAVRSQLVINDGMTSTLRRINKAMSLMLDNFEAVQRASGKSINIENLNATRQELGKANAQLDAMEEHYRNINNQQDNFNRGLGTGSSNAEKLMGKIKNIAAAYVGIQGLSKLTELSDTMTSNRARLGLIVDDGGSVTELEQKIYASAQRSRSYYIDTMATVSKLGLVAGKAFNGTDEIIAFQELLNKNFVVGGASATERASAMYQLTQAMGSGRLQGDEYRSIIENAPLLAESIEDYMRNVRGATGSMKEWASEGLLTADVIKAAVFKSADEIEERFDKMPMTWGQLWTTMKNAALMTFQPILQRINDIANNESFQAFAANAINALAVVANILLDIFEFAAMVGNFVAENWSVIAPIVWGIVAALGAYYGAMLLYNTVTGISTAITAVKSFMETVHAASLAMQTGATFTATAAQYGFNAALLACPITWIVAAVLALIVAFYALIAWINKTKNTSISATGIIFGYFAAMAAGIINYFIMIYNYTATVAEFLLNVFNNPTYAVKKLFGGLAVTVLDFCIAATSGFDEVATNLANAFISGANLAIRGINWIIEALNKIPGVNIGTIGKLDAVASITSELTGLKNSINAWVGEVPSDYIEIAKKDYITVGDWASAGYDFGANVEDSVKGIFDGTTAASFAEGLLGEGSQISSNIADTAGNTGSMADSMDITSEDLKYLRDIAEKEAINRFTTAEIKVDFSGMTNRIDSDMDVDGVVERLTDGFVEALVTAAEGVHV